MLPYSRGLILDNTNNYGIVKTEAVFGFGPLNNSNYVNDNINSTKPLEWILTSEDFHERSLQGKLCRWLALDIRVQVENSYLNLSNCFVTGAFSNIKPT